MARLTAPNGATVNVSDEKAERLLGLGFKEAGESKPKSAPRKASASKKSE